VGWGQAGKLVCVDVGGWLEGGWQVVRKAKVDAWGEGLDNAEEVAWWFGCGIQRNGFIGLKVRERKSLARVGERESIFAVVGGEAG
jgi:hypothetical protein